MALELLTHRLRPYFQCFHSTAASVLTSKLVGFVQTGLLKGSDSLYPSPQAHPQSFDSRHYHENASDYGDRNPLLVGFCDLDTVVHKLKRDIIQTCASKCTATAPPQSLPDDVSDLLTLSALV